jgi:hypothetical protein
METSKCNHFVYLRHHRFINIWLTKKKAFRKLNKIIKLMKNRAFYFRFTFNSFKCLQNNHLVEFYVLIAQKFLLFFNGNRKKSQLKSSLLDGNLISTPQRSASQQSHELEFMSQFLVMTFISTELVIIKIWW